MAARPAQAADLRSAEGYPSAREAWYTVAVLYVAYALAHVDRQLIVYLLEPMRADFPISDFELGLINGFVYVVVYALVGIPLAVLADRGRRRGIVAIGIGVWSLMTLMCGRAFGTVTLLFARAGTGAGEAAFLPASVSMIADSFPPDSRGLAINTHAAGMHGGIGLAHIFGGAIVAATAALTGFSVPVVGNIAPWQLAFVIAALPGIVVLALLASLREPKRQSRVALRGGTRLRDTLVFMRRHWYVYNSLILGASLSAIGSFGLFVWVPVLFERVHGWSSGLTGLVFGVLTIVFGTAGLVLSGAYAGTFIRRGADVVYQRLMMLSVACAIVPGAISITTDSAWGMWACIAAVVFFLGMPIGLATAGIAAITPNRMRAQVIAIYMTALNLIGMGGGAVAVAAVTDFVFGEATAVGRSIGIVIVVSGVLSVLLLAFGVRQYEEMGRRAE